MVENLELKSLLDPLERGDGLEEDDLEICEDRSGPLFYTKSPPTKLQKSVEWILVKCTKGTAHIATSRPLRRKSSWRTVFLICIQVPLVLVVLFLALTPALFPSYLDPPFRYQVLRSIVNDATNPGRANLNNEKVFIAASIYDADGQLAGGAWGERLAQLVNILGPDNVFLSIYEDNASPIAASALDSLASKVSCTLFR